MDSGLSAERIMLIDLSYHTFYIRKTFSFLEKKINVLPEYKMFRVLSFFAIYYIVTNKRQQNTLKSVTYTKASKNIVHL